ncbi:MAG: AAA family ATPase [Bacilli bacterium]|nr:AAA family ATPase [Bacilli bacterium]
MQRKIMDNLIMWKKSTRKKSMIIIGARQVGKTYIIREFAHNNYPQNKIIEMNFELFPDAKEFFENDLSPDAIMSKIHLNIKYQNIDFKNDENNPYLIFLDEIQSCENALISLKSFTQESKLYHVIATGSLLGVSLKREFNGSYPVGYVEHLEMYPLDFEEFLWANNINQDYVNTMKNSFYDTSSITKDTHDKLIILFRQYIIIGGLPEVINEFIQTKDYDMVYKVQKDLKIGYIQDIKKYAKDNNLKEKIEMCFNSIPNHLKEQNKKFMYKRVEVNGRERMFKGALDWLYDAGLIIYCNNTKRIEKPIDVYRIEDSFKLFMFDTGILMSMFDSDKRYQVLNGGEDFDIGGIYENAIACILEKYEHTKDILYYNDNIIDIDFIAKSGNDLLAIEVKSGNNIKSLSLKKFSENNKFKYVISVKVSSKLIKEDTNIRNIPFYSFALISSTKND